MRRHWKMIAIMASVAVAGLSVVAVASGATTIKNTCSGRGACSALTSNPEALKAMDALRTENRAEMQAWYAKYSADPTSAEARAAHQKIREEHWSEMRALLEKYNVAIPEGAGPGSGGQGGMMGGGGGGGCGGAGGMMGGNGGGMMGGAGY
jgi:hypothetical protein